jgi:hypothetical protein
MLDIDVVSEAVSALGMGEAPIPVLHRSLDRDAEPSAVAGARVLLVGDLSDATRTALDCAEELAADGASVEVYYRWSASGDVTSADRVAAELGILSSEPGAIDLLDRMTALQRRGILTVRGCMTPEAHGGSSLSALATRAGYHMVLLGLRRTPEESHRFRLHTFS